GEFMNHASTMLLGALALRTAAWAYRRSRQDSRIREMRDSWATEPDPNPIPIRNPNPPEPCLLTHPLRRTGGKGIRLGIGLGSARSPRGHPPRPPGVYLDAAALCGLAVGLAFTVRPLTAAA